MAKGKYSVGVEVRGFDRTGGPLRRVGQNLKRVGRSARRIKTGFRAARSEVQGLGRSLRGLKGLGFGVLAGGGLFAGAIAGFRSVSDHLDKLDKASKRLGLPTDLLQKWQYAAQQSGVRTETFNMAFQRFTRRIGEARKGSGEAVKAFNQLGIKGKKANGEWKSNTELFYEVADALNRVKDAETRTALAMRFFDSEGVALIQMMGQGASGLRDFEKQAEKAGVIIDEKMIASTVKLRDTMNLTKMSIRGTIANALQPMIPELEANANAFRKWVSEGEGAEKIRDTLRDTIGFAKGMARGFRDVGSAVKGFADKVTAFLPGGDDLKSSLQDVEKAGGAAAKVISGLVGFMVVKKVAGFAAALVKVATPLGIIGKAAGGKLLPGAAGKALGKMGATPVYVTNMGERGMGGFGADKKNEGVAKGGKLAKIGNVAKKIGTGMLVGGSAAVTTAAVMAPWAAVTGGLIAASKLPGAKEGRDQNAEIVRQRNRQNTGRNFKLPSAAEWKKMTKEERKSFLSGSPPQSARPESNFRSDLMPLKDYIPKFDGRMAIEIKTEPGTMAIIKQIEDRGNTDIDLSASQTIGLTR